MNDNKINSSNFYNARFAVKTDQITIIRTSNLDKCSDDEIANISQLVNGIIDLRHIKEAPHSIELFKKHHIDYFNDTIDIKPLYQYYFNIGNGKIKNKIDARYQFVIDLLNEKTQLKRILSIIMKCKYKVAIYCNNGRYRTGIICLIIEYLLGMKKEYIISDFIESSLNINDNNAEDYEKLNKDESLILIKMIFDSFEKCEFFKDYKFFIDNLKIKTNY